ncbi:MAG: peptidylprolyl isomerase [Alphaproteobacteria bacterium]|nr:peptidylprolyl isomerase [Alphaproteobacteria bacterium]
MPEINNEINKTNSNAKQRGNVAIIALVVLAVVAVGATIVLSGKIGGDKSATQTTPEVAATQASPAETETAAGDETAADATEPASEKAEDKTAEAKTPAEAPVIEPGNPVVAKVNGRDISRLDVFNFIQTLSPQIRQMPVEQLFPLALDQVVNAELIGEKVKKEPELEKDPAVQEQLKIAKQQIVRSVFMQKEAEKAVTEDMIKAAYEDYKKNFPEVEEIKARHILVKDEALARDLIKQIKDGGDFAALAKEHSIDATKERGGELNFFSKQDVVPEFADASFSMDVNEVSDKPVKSEFGYHVIQVLEKRQRPPADYEQAKPYLLAQLRGKVLGDVVQKWRENAKIETFDINGKPETTEETAPKAE